MNNLSLEVLCEGMVHVNENAEALLDDAKLLLSQNRTARAYALAYMACEESGKLSILIGTAAQVALKKPVDWKKVRKRFRSHDSKASQFLGVANGASVIEAAAKAGKKSLNIEEVMLKALAGIVVGPTLFSERNASIYCDFEGRAFTTPNAQITKEMADRMIEIAERNVRTGKKLIGNSTEQTATMIARITDKKYENVIAYSTEFAKSILKSSSTKSASQK